MSLAQGRIGRMTVAACGVLAVVAAAPGQTYAAELTSPTIVHPLAASQSCPGYFDADGDGLQDLALGTPGENVQVGGVAYLNSGTVTLVHGDSAGQFGSSGSTLLTQEDVGLVSQTDDQFGAAVATADLNGDQCADLVIGVPGEHAHAGAVVVIWGSPTGLDSANHQLLRQGESPIGSEAEPGDGFGSAVAVAGSLPTGGAASLWISAPGEDIGRIRDAGLVTEVAASPDEPLGVAGVTSWSQNTKGVPGAVETGDAFGTALSGGPRTLMVGVPYEDVGRATDAGIYAVFSLASRSWTSYSQNSKGVPGVVERGDRFGASLARVPGCSSSTDEVWAVGSPGEDVGSVKNAGTVTLRDRQGHAGAVLRQGGPIPGVAERGDGFGAALVGVGSLAIGVPGEDLGGRLDGGVVSVIDVGCTAKGAPVVDAAESWSQGSIPGGSVKPGNRFGSALGASLVENAGEVGLEYRLVVAAPGADEGQVTDAGTVTVFGTGLSGLTPAGARTFGQTTPGILGTPQDGDRFGSSLDAADALAL